jgi:hypothetical protein
MAKQVYPPPTPKSPKSKKADAFHAELLGDDNWHTVDLSKVQKPRKD